MDLQNRTGDLYGLVRIQQDLNGACNVMQTPDVVATILQKNKERRKENNNNRFFVSSAILHNLEWII